MTAAVLAALLDALERLWVGRSLHVPIKWNHLSDKDAAQTQALELAEFYDGLFFDEPDEAKDGAPRSS